MFRQFFDYIGQLLARLFGGGNKMEKQQLPCIFCDTEALDKILYQDEDVIAFEDIDPSGKVHWLVSPIEHIRDIEVLTHENLPLLEKMEQLKMQLLREHYPDVPKSSLHTGYHRGRRPIFGTVMTWLLWPDIISVQHLHLHIIIEPRPAKKWLKYPPWLLWMWKSDAVLMQELRRKKLA